MDQFFEPPREEVKRVYFPVFLLIIGVYFLLRNLGYIAAETASIIWPVFIIAFALIMLFEKGGGHSWCCGPWGSKKKK